MKFYMVAKYYLENLSFKFHEDPCTNAHTSCKRACVRFIASACMVFSLACENKVNSLYVKLRLSFNTERISTKK